jgi:hypothetical protein
LQPRSSQFSKRWKASVSVSVIKNGKSGKEGLEGPWLERYENQKAMTAEAPPWRLFRVISRGRPVAANFCAFATVFRNPVTGNTSRV